MFPFPAADRLIHPFSSTVQAQVCGKPGEGDGSSPGTVRANWGCEGGCVTVAECQRCIGFWDPWALNLFAVRTPFVYNIQVERGTHYEAPVDRKLYDIWCYRLTSKCPWNRLRLLKKVADQIRKTTVACLDHHIIIKHPDSHNFHFRQLIWYQWSGA